MMQISDFSSWASAPPSWVTSSGDDLHETVISSRVRLARNFLGVPFPHNSSGAIQKKNIDRAFEALRVSKIMKKSHPFRLNQLTAMERGFLMERQLISHEQAGKQGETGLVVSSGEQVSVMLNEEDHLRAASFTPGMGLSDAWEKLSDLDDELASKIPFSFNQEFGYITACPTNLGTALRASCLLHLPALVLTGKIQSVISKLSIDGLTARGFYGEGTTALGDLFQISNARTLCLSEMEIIRYVEQAIKQVAELEMKEMHGLLSAGYRAKTEDAVFRSLGTLREARLLNFTESMKHLSHVRMGAKMVLDVPLQAEKVSRLFFLAQPIHLQIRESKKVDQPADEHLRAAFLNSVFGRT